jgi:site-specific recombinase XerD
MSLHFASFDSGFNLQNVKFPEAQLSRQSKLIEQAKSQSLIDIFISNYRLNEQNALNRFQKTLRHGPQETQRAYLADVYLALITKFFKFWNFPTEFNPVAKTLILLHVLDRAGHSYQRGEIASETAAKFILLAQKLEKQADTKLTLSKQYDQNKVLNKLLGSDFTLSVNDGLMQMQLRKSMEVENKAVKVPVRNVDSSMLSFVFSQHTDLLGKNFWDHFFKPPTIKEILDEQRACGNSENTIARKMASLRRFEQFLFESGETNTSILGAMKRPRINHNVQVVLTEAESDKIFKVAERSCSLARTTTDKFYAWRNLVMLNLLDYTTVRGSALCNLKIHDLNLAEKKIIFKDKGNKKFLKDIDPKIINQLKFYLEVRKEYLKAYKKIDNDSVFLNKFGKNLTRRSLSRIVNELASDARIDKSKIGKIGTHTIRRSVATQMSQNGAHLEDIQKVLDHKYPSTTQIYVRQDTSETQRIAKKFHPRYRDE